jgi:uncharacterized protein with PIN domain
MRRAVTHGYDVWETEPERQAAAVLHRFRLFDAAAPFRRCPRCNGRLAAVPKAEVLDHLPSLTRRHDDDSVRCAGFGRAYWKGAHFRRLERVVARLLSRRPPGPLTPPPAGA